MAFAMLFVVFVCSLSAASHANDDCQLRLIRDLLHRSVYDTAMRPVTQANQTVNVTVTASLFQIMELDEQKQEINLNLWMTFDWTDPHFTWDPQQYCGMDSFTVANYRVWKPDVVLYNSISEENTGIRIFADTDVKIYHDGHVRWPTLAVIRAACRVYFRDFPFDKQDCPLLFSSWTDDCSMTMLLPSSDSAVLDSYVESGEWTLLEVPAELQLSPHGSNDRLYAEIVYTVKIKRKPLFFMFNLVLPCILLMGVGILTFCLAPNTGEKIPLCTTILLTMMFFQIMLSDSMPPTSDAIPLLTQFFAVSVILLVLSTVCAVMVLALFDNALRGRQVPDWLRHATWRISWFVCLRSRAEGILHEDPEETQANEGAAEQETGNQEGTAAELFEDKWNTLKKNTTGQETEQHLANGVKPNGMMKSTMETTFDIAESIHQVAETYISTEERKRNLRQITRDWHIVIHVIDRSLLYLFSLVTVLFSMVILLLAGV